MAAVTLRGKRAVSPPRGGPERGCTVRGIDPRGTDFDGLEPVDPPAAAGKLPLDQADELTGCVLSGDLPCTIAIGGQRRPATIAFSLYLRPGIAVLPGSAHTLTVSLVLDGVTCVPAEDNLPITQRDMP